MRGQIQLKHCSFHTEEAHAYWTREYILFHKAKTGAFRHPGEMGISEVNQFLTHLAVDRKVSTSTISKPACVIKLIAIRFPTLF